MTRSTLVFLLLFQLNSIPCLSEITDLLLEARVSSRFGTTSYELEERDEFLDAVYSLLEFPLNTVFLGASCSLALESQNERKFEIRGGCVVNICDPWGTMKDSDWIQYFGYPKIKISYTESRAELFAFEFFFEGRMQIVPELVSTLYVTGGYGFLTYSEDIIGYEGWFIDPDTGDMVDYPTNKDDLAIEYDISYHTPYLGILWKWNVSQTIAADLGANVSLVYVSDRDDHVIRGKLSTASGGGIGIQALCSVMFFPFEAAGQGSPYFRLNVEVTYLAANIQQTQQWYEDEGTTPAGTIVHGIGHKIRSLQLGTGVMVGYRFAF